MSGSMDNPADAEAEADRARAGLVNTLNQLRENLKPANVVDEVMGSAKVNAAAMADQVWDTARRNPLPALMIGAGLAMIFGLGDSTPAAKDEPAGAARPPAPPLPTSAPGVPPLTDGPRPRDPLHAGEGSVTRGGNRASTLLDEANRRVADTAARATAKVHQAFKPVTEADPMTTLDQTSDKLGRSLNRLVEEQPLILAAIGVAVGAAIGASLPRTERENSLMGGSSHALRDTATSLAQEQVAQLKSAATHAVEDMKQTVADHGVNADNLSGLVNDLGEKTRAAAYEAGRSLDPKA